MKIVWTRLALSDLDRAYSYIAEERPASAAHIIERMEKAAQVLIHHPQMGRRGRVGGTYELVISHTPFIMAYRVKADKIEILSVIHTSRKWPDTL